MDQTEGSGSCGMLWVILGWSPWYETHVRVFLGGLDARSRVHQHALTTGKCQSRLVVLDKVAISLGRTYQESRHAL